MNEIVSTLRPGLLVSLSIRVSGNVTYNTRDLERRHRSEDGAERARWETERVVANPGELKRAEKVRATARQLINKTCARSMFGLLCPNSWEAELYSNIAAARQLAAEFNARARCTEVSIYVIVGRVAQDDVEAVRAINSEIRGLMREMTEGVKNLDAKRVREAAGRARSIGMMLSDEASEKIKAAIEAARASARKIVKAGDAVSGVIDKEAIKKINQARTAFLDLGEEEVLLERPRTAGRAVDLQPEEAATPRKLSRAALRDASSAVEAARGRAKVVGRIPPKPQQLEFDGLFDGASRTTAKSTKKRSTAR